VKIWKKLETKALSISSMNLNLPQLTGQGNDRIRTLTILLSFGPSPDEAVS